MLARVVLGVALVVFVAGRLARTGSRRRLRRFAALGQNLAAVAAAIAAVGLVVLAGDALVFLDATPCGRAVRGGHPLVLAVFAVLALATVGGLVGYGRTLPPRLARVTLGGCAAVVLFAALRSPGVYSAHASFCG